MKEVESCCSCASFILLKASQSRADQVKQTSRKSKKVSMGGTIQWCSGLCQQTFRWERTVEISKNKQTIPYKKALVRLFSSSSVRNTPFQLLSLVSIPAFVWVAHEQKVWTANGGLCGHSQIHVPQWHQTAKTTVKVFRAVWSPKHFWLTGIVCLYADIITWN